MEVAPLLILLLLGVVLVISFVLRMWRKEEMIVVASIVVGAFLGPVVGFVVGVGLGPGPEAGMMYGLDRFLSGLAGGAVGLVIGPILGGACGWALERRTSRNLSRDPDFLRRHYEQVDGAMRVRPETDLVIDTSSVGVLDAARAIYRWASPTT